MADDSFRLLSFTFARPSFRYTTGNGSSRDWPGLNRITGRAGLPRVFRKTPSSLWQGPVAFSCFLPGTIRHPSVYVTSMSCSVCTTYRYLIVTPKKGCLNKSLVVIYITYIGIYIIPYFLPLLISTRTFRIHCSSYYFELS